MKKAMTKSLLLLSLFAAFPFHAQQTDTHGLHAVPAENIKIDGKLDDWDLSGQTIMCYDIDSLADTYSGKVAMAYDKDNLYISIQWKDPKPLGNSHDPQFESHCGWAGDAVQLRIMTDLVSHITAWYFAPNKEPFIEIEYGKSLTKAFGGGSKKVKQLKGWQLSDGAEMAFKEDADGKGYVQEIKLPWKLITKSKRYQPGDHLRCGVELLWGEADRPCHRYADNLSEGSNAREFFWKALSAWGKVILEPTGNLSLPEPTWKRKSESEKAEGPIKITYKIPKDCRVTIAINDNQGKRIRNLLAAAKRKAGTHTERWNGLNDKGELITPGTYQVKGLTHDGLHLSYTGAFSSPGNPPWKSANGKGAFYGDHTPPEAVAAGKEMIALACPMGEAGKHLIGVDLKGQRQWGLANRIAFGGGKISLATDGRILFIANADGRSQRFTIWRCYLKNGKYAPWQRKDKNSKQILDLELLADEATENCRAITIHGNQLAVILAKKRDVLILNATTGDKLKCIKNMPADMTGCAYNSQGELFIATSDKLYKLNSNDIPQQLLTRLDHCSSITFGPKGNLYIAQRGSTQAVDVYSPELKKIRRIGRSGGRPVYGKFIDNGMQNPSQIAVDSQHRLWVTESTMNPKRVSIWNSQNGKLDFDLVGTTTYCGAGILNPFDHTLGISNGVEYKLDFTNKKARPIFGFKSPFPITEDPHHVGTGDVLNLTKISKVNGRQYVQSKSSAREATSTRIYARQQDGSWRAVAAFGNVGCGKSIDDKRHKKYNKRFQHPLWDGLFGKAFIWVDKNDDGIAQRDELETRDQQFRSFYWGQAMGDDLSVPYMISSDNRLKFGAREISIFKPESYSKSGVPQYSFSNTHTVKIPDHIKLRGEGMIAIGRNDRLYINMKPLTAISKNGQQLWSYPNKYLSVHGSHKAPTAKAGMLIGPSSFYGRAYINDDIGEVFYLNGNLGQNFILTEDGLWVQSLYKDTRGYFDVPDNATPGMPCDTMTAGGESFYGHFCKSVNGKYYTTGGATAAVVMEITGLNSLKRFKQTVQVTPKNLVEAQQLKIKKSALKTAKKTYTIKYVDSAPGLDGNLKSWNMNKDSITMQEGRHKFGKIKALYDDKNLYLAYQVNDRQAPLKNTGQNEQLMFISGDCVDLMLRTNPNAAGSKPQAGDLRLLMTVKAGKPLAVIYRPVVPGTPKDSRTALSSPWRSVYFDQIKTVDFPLTLSRSRRGYNVTAAIPLQVLGVKSLKGKKLRGDVGILNSDPGGQETVSRKYWSNKFTNNTNDVPDEALVTPALWGELSFK